MKTKNKVGIEIELSSTEYNIRDIAFETGIPLLERGNNICWFIKKENTRVRLAEEYYSNQIEYNFFPTSYRSKKIKSIQNFITYQISKYWLDISAPSPAYIGTHIHIFDPTIIEKYYNNTLVYCKILSYILDNSSCITNRYSLERLACSHHLWGAISASLVQNNRRKIGLPQIEFNISNKVKYRPFYLSPEIGGKPLSLEIRIIPNEFLLNWLAEKLIKEIFSWKIEKRREVKVREFTDYFTNKIIWL